MIFIFNSLLNDFLQCVVWDEQRDVTMWSDMLRCLWLFNCHHVMSCWSIHSVRHEIDKAEGKSEESNLVYTSCVTSTSEYKTLKSLLPVITKLTLIKAEWSTRILHWHFIWPRFCCQTYLAIVSSKNILQIDHQLMRPDPLVKHYPYGRSIFKIDFIKILIADLDSSQKSIWRNYPSF